MNINDPKYLRNLFRLRSGGFDSLGAADAIATGQIFLESELNKADTRVRMPLEGHTYFRDIPIQTGGGWVDTETGAFVDVSGPSTSHGTGTGSNDIGVIEYNRSQDVYPTFGYQRSVRIPLIESLKLAQANKSPNDILDKAVRIDWHKTLDRRVYSGDFGHKGLLNHALVTAQSMQNGTQASPGPSWTTKSVLDLYNDFNFMAKTQWALGGYSSEAIPDRFLIPATAYDKLLQPMVLAGGVTLTQNVLEYIKGNYYGKTFGITPEIYPVPYWLETAGAGTTRRVVAYRFNDDCLAFGILQDITRQGGALSLQDGAFVTTYVANMGVVKIFRPQTIGYFDGI